MAFCCLWMAANSPEAGAAPGQPAPEELVDIKHD
jgi:hypothetical protein